ncbi:MAG: aminodeoxychorismate synthase component I [Desulfobacterales bacterium]|nr:aminodeoxychorismate synthase component I [Desulfobacterales bacterium]
MNKIQSKILELTGKITEIQSNFIDISEDFMTFSGRFASLNGTVLLMSGTNLDCSNYNILGIMPWISFKYYRNKAVIDIFGETIEFEDDPLNILDFILHSFKLDYKSLPIEAGLMGYISYDVKDFIEKLPKTSIDDLGLPDICLFAPSIIIVNEKLTGKNKIHIVKRSKEKINENIISAFNKITSEEYIQCHEFKGGSNELKSSLSKEEYIDSIKIIKEYIRQGHVYQVNMSQRFITDFSGSAFGLFKQLYNLNPAPFFAYINALDHHIVSTSPERFILRDGKNIETRPIKGTNPRGKTPDEDDRLKIELSASKKDDAELSMIVDLLRNDIGKFSKAGSVQVNEHKRVEAYQNVFHLISIISGILDDGKDSIDLIKAVFPGGSITGCPKIRSMEIIDELEPVRRHIYTGSIGYISFHDTLDLSIAIRTATIYKEKIIFSVGGGIVYDSDPESEFDETMHKGQTLINAISNNIESNKKLNYLWMNGKLMPEENAFISVLDYGFVYGYGFFETIRVDNGSIRYLNEHINRFKFAWKNFFDEPFPNITWKDIIEQILMKSDLQNATVAVKIIAAKGSQKSSMLNYNLIVTAKPYIHRLKNKKDRCVNLVIYPSPRFSRLAAHKTLNYLYYFLAGQWARDKGADEALIMNPCGTISETNTANILLIKNKTVILPISKYVLPGIMQEAVCALLKEWDFEIQKKKIKIKDLFSFEQILITNSLIGAVQVLKINGKKIFEPFDLWKRINTALSITL